MTDTQWHDPDLAKDRDDVQKHQVLIGKAEAEWEQLERRTDFVADKRREELRAMMPPLYARRDARLRRIEAGVERERIVNAVLWPLHTQKLGSLERRFERMATSPDVPGDDEFVELYIDSLEVERLRLVLHETTQADEFRRGFDAPRALRSHWTAVHKDRERLFHLVGPGNKPRLGEAAWLDQARRLTELRATSTPQRENAYVV
jgi:hypothetical protein